YHRPPLSKAFLQGSTSQESLALKPAVMYEKAAIVRQGGVRVTDIEPDDRRILYGDGQVLSYDKLVLACGGRARKIDGSMAGASEGGNVYYLRTLDDALQLRSVLECGRRIVVVGAGYVGLEV